MLEIVLLLDLAFKPEKISIAKVELILHFNRHHWIQQILLVCKLFTEKITLFWTAGKINQMYHFTSGSFLNILVQMNKTIVITSLLLRLLFMSVQVVSCRMIQLFVTFLELYRVNQTKGNTFKCFDRFYWYFAYYFRLFKKIHWARFSIFNVRLACINNRLGPTS